MAKISGGTSEHRSNKSGCAGSTSWSNGSFSRTARAWENGGTPARKRISALKTKNIRNIFANDEKKKLLTVNNFRFRWKTFAPTALRRWVYWRRSCRDSTAHSGGTLSHSKWDPAPERIFFIQQLKFVIVKFVLGVKSGKEMAYPCEIIVAFVPSAKAPRIDEAENVGRSFGGEELEMRVLGNLVESRRIYTQPLGTIMWNREIVLYTVEKAANQSINPSIKWSIEESAALIVWSNKRLINWLIDH